MSFYVVLYDAINWGLPKKPYMWRAIKKNSGYYKIYMCLLCSVSLVSQEVLWWQKLLTPSCTSTTFVTRGVIQIWMVSGFESSWFRQIWEMSESNWADRIKWNNWNMDLEGHRNTDNVSKNYILLSEFTIYWNTSLVDERREQNFVTNIACL